MIRIIPAVDLKDGKVVRLTRGDFSREKIYSEAPEDVVQKWQKEGAKLIHVVDLDGALTGRRKNLGSLKNICAVAKVPIQFGGGLRTLQSVEEIFAAGISRAVIGTKALDLKLLKQLVKKFTDRIVVGLDVRHNILQIQGWRKQVKVVELDSFCKEIERIGIQHVVHTDVLRDGTLLGPNVQALEKICGATEMNVIASGGVSKLDDLRTLSAMPHSNLWGIIIGKALYEKRFSLPEAIRAVKEPAT